MSGSPLPKVLIADDDPGIRLLLRTVFDRDERFGEVQAVDGGTDAVTQAGIMRPSVIILDLGMWRLSGYEALPLIRSRCPDAAIVIYSSSARPGDREEAVARGADDVVDKSKGAVDLPEIALNALAARRGS